MDQTPTQHTAGHHTHHGTHRLLVTSCTILRITDHGATIPGIRPITPTAALTGIGDSAIRIIHRTHRGMAVVMDTDMAMVPVTTRIHIGLPHHDDGDRSGPSPVRQVLVLYRRE